MTNTAHDLFQEAQLCLLNGEVSKSVTLFSQAEKEGCNPVNVHLSKGVAHMRLKEFDKAVEDFSIVVGIDSLNDRAFYYRGVARMNQGDFQGAELDLSRSLALNHERGIAFFARGLVNAQLGEQEAALRDFKTAVTFSTREVNRFVSDFSSHRSLFDRSMALLDGERGPWSIVMTQDEVEKLKGFME